MRLMMLPTLLAISLLAGCNQSEELPAEEAATVTRRPASLGQPPARSDSNAASPAERRNNQPPNAGYHVSPPEGWAGITMLHFDAAFSDDDWDATHHLQKRWDYDGDGTWDTPFTRPARVGHTFDVPGEYRPRLQVKDTGGLMDSVVGDPIIIHPPCPPPDFALCDVNPNSPTVGETCRLSEQRGHRVILWFSSPSK